MREIQLTVTVTTDDTHVSAERVAEWVYRALVGEGGVAGLSPVVSVQSDGR